MNVKIREKIGRRFFLPGSQASYSQFGEDLIICHLFNSIGILHPTYLDIGANHPRYISNTYFFYQRGSRGVLIEPNPRLSKRLRAARPGDVVLEVGIGASAQSEADFYLFPDAADGLSTFSKAEAEHWEKVGMKGRGKLRIEAVLKLQMIPINQVIAAHFPDAPPNFLSLDIEGLDLEILKSLDFEHFAPDVVCVETLAYDKNQNGYKLNDTIAFMLSKGYLAYADTRVNTIFCKNKLVDAG